MWAPFTLVVSVTSCAIEWSDKEVQAFQEKVAAVFATQLEIASLAPNVMLQQSLALLEPLCTQLNDTSPADMMIR